MGFAFREAEEHRLHGSSIASSSVPAPPPHSPVPKKETMSNPTQMLHEMPHYKGVEFEPLETTEPFPQTVQLPFGVNIESPHSVQPITLLSGFIISQSNHIATIRYRLFSLWLSRSAYAYDMYAVR